MPQLQTIEMANYSDILQEQGTFIKEFEKVVENFKKEPIDRLLKKDRLEQWLQRLYDPMSKLFKNHEVLKQNKDIQNEKYFVEKWYDTHLIIYEEMKKEIKTRIQSIEAINITAVSTAGTSTQSTSTAGTSKMNNTTSIAANSTIRPDPTVRNDDGGPQRNRHDDTINESVIDLCELNASITTGKQIRDFDSSMEFMELAKIENMVDAGNRQRAVRRLQALDMVWQEIKSEGRKILALVERKYAAKFDNLSDHYYDVLEELEDENHFRRGMEPLGLKLQPIKIPPFGRDLKKWPAFSELFESLIIKNLSLSNIQRMQYLKSNINGDAAKQINQMEITGNNFDAAWGLLKNRYEHKRAITNASFESFFGQEKVTQESVTKLQNLIDQSRECYSLLSGLSIDQAILFYMTKFIDRASFI